MNTTLLAGMKLIPFKKIGDDRGFFCEIWKDEDLVKETGIPFWSQANLSRSQKNVLRGLHFQRAPFAQAKLVMITRGTVWDVCVDIRPGSSTYGQSCGVELSDKTPQLLFIPEGFAHGFCVLSDEADFLYRCSKPYHPVSEGGLVWNDPQLKIQWPVKKPLVSERDKNWPTFAQL